MVDFEEEAETGFERAPDVSDEALKRIAVLAEHQLREQERVENLEQELKLAKEALRRTSEVDLPEAMREVNMESFTLMNGKSIALAKEMYASIAKKNKHKAVEWLLQHGLETLVKQDVVFNFEKGQSEAVNNLLELADANEFRQHTIEESVHTGQVKSAIKEMLANGIDVPLELFGAHFVTRAVIS